MSKLMEFIVCIVGLMNMNNVSLTLFHKTVDEVTKTYKTEEYLLSNVSCQGYDGIVVGEDQNKNSAYQLWLFYKDIPNLKNIPFSLGDTISKKGIKDGLTIAKIQDNNYGSNDVNHIYIELK